MAINVSNSYDWDQLYADLQKTTQIPGIRSIKNTDSQLIFRDMVVNLDDVLAEINRFETAPAMVFIYADIVRMPAERNWLLSNTGLFIAARRIIAASATFFQLDFRKAENNSSLILYANEIEGTLKAAAFHSSDPQQSPDFYDLSFFDGLGVQIVSQDGIILRKNLSYIDEESLVLGKELWMSLSCIFQFATILIDKEPEITRAMLNWIKSMTASSSNAQDMYLQASSLLSDLTLSSSQVNFVPYLSKTVYVEEAKAFGEAAVQYEVEYNRFKQEKENKEQWISAIKQMQHYYELTCDFNQQLIVQAKENMNNAQAAVNEATRQLNWQKFKVDEAALSFKTAVEIWKEDQILKAVFDICGALIEFVGSIAAIAVGDEAAGASAGKAVEEAGKAAADAAKAGEKAAKMSKTMKQLAEAMKKLKKAGQALEKTYKFINEIIKAAQNIQHASKFDDFSVPDDDDISCQVEWDIFQLEVKNMLIGVIDAGIKEARNYQLELDKLAVYGKALSATQTSLIRISQELARLYMQKHVSDAMKASLDEGLKKLEQDIKPDETLMHMLYVRGLNMKHWIYMAIRNYTQAYRYWALAESMIRPAITKSAGELKEDLAKIQQDYAQALSSFNPPPQEFGVLGHGKTMLINDQSILEEFKSKRIIRVIVPLDLRDFCGFGRVRLYTVRVWLYGIAADDPLYLNIENTGAYYDRLSDKTYRFTSIALNRKFQYQGTPGNRESILVDGSVADEEKYAYFQPTPFTEWSISLPEQQNPKHDLTGLTKISMEFAGQVIGQ